ncbi:four-carbon acid sugar kinase family protein [Bosea sp. F3-2]|uniref:four-carbon acid sugar kinase family protein n=1 Tax=Bosea sp. F3-2 TaxID=2599640 RepID=UPI0011EC8917|nr:four-carbon acid sugar kinase family protein [Bosea sp. F3-2]QEL24038.1 four-carbon acid sugar kinase family protein [Bosea sp. F3-2]
MVAKQTPLYGWYGDDFTGSTDTLATLAERGFRALLFLRQPSEAQLAAAGPLDAIGIAGASRTMAPEAIVAELAEIGRFFAGLGVGLMHYKCCSTFDSAPHVGSIGAAVAALKPHFPNPLVPILGGQPNLGRYCLFGHLFAAGGDGTIHRIDRHPTMSRHPVTPMAEADLRRHLAAQGLADVELVDYRAYAGGGAATALAPVRTGATQAILFDVAEEADLKAIGGLLAAALTDGPMLAVGASSVARAFAAGHPKEIAATTAAEARQRGGGPLLALVGSLSPVTRAQVEAARGYAMLPIEPGRLLSDEDYAAQLQAATLSKLGQGDVMLVTEQPEGAPAAAGEVASATGRLLTAIVAEAHLSRLVIAGGDTSTMAIRALALWGLSYRGPCVPGAPLCRAHSDDPQLDGLDIVLKGGQMGPPGFFNDEARA